jgi:hypothetical protein
MTAHTPNIDDEITDRYERLAAAERIRVEVYVRSLAPPPGPKQQQETVLNRLDRLESAGIVDETTVSVWGKAICLDGPYRKTAACRRIEDRIDRFREWAASAGATIELPFETQSVTSSIFDDEYERLVPPQVCLAVQTEDGIALVLPCEIDDTPLSVVGTLERLGAIAEAPADPPSQSTSSI